MSKINNTLTYNAEDLSIVMPRYNLLEHGQNFSITSGSFGHYYRDEIDDVDDNDGKSCKYKTKKVEKSPRRPERLPQPSQPPTNLDASQPPEPLQPPRQP